MVEARYLVSCFCLCCAFENGKWKSWGENGVVSRIENFVFGVYFCWESENPLKF